MVIIDPYEGIDYDKINVYEIEQSYCGDYEDDRCDMNYWEAEGFSEPEPVKEEQHTDVYKQSDVFIPFLLEYLKK